MIEIKNIYKRFGDRDVLKGINLCFERGKTTLIIGESGSGKTVLMKICTGLLEPDTGYISFDGRVFSGIAEQGKTLIRKEMGVLFQGGALFDSMNVEQNVMFPLDMFTNMSNKEKKERVEFCLERVNLKNAGNLYPAEISGGMMKRVAIARAIANNPKYLFCDEPNSGLDPKTSEIIDQLIKELTEEYNITTIVNTHDMNSVLMIGDKINYIYKGKLWWEGDNKTILSATNPELCNFVFSTELTRRIKENTKC